MLPDEVTISFRPRLLLVSPLAVFLVAGSFYIPWGAESAPAWAQAIGTIGAVIAALMIANHQHAVATARAAAERQEKESALSKRLAFFALELEQVVSNVVLDQWCTGIEEADQRVVVVLDFMLQRINTCFDDDLNVERVSILYEFRIVISGLIFTLSSTKGLDPGDRDKSVASYKGLVKGLLERCTQHAKGHHVRD